MDILNKFELTPYFDLLAGAALDGSRDHKADVIAYLLQQTGNEMEAVMVGDTVYDVVGATAHGIPTIGVSWGYGSIAEMQNAGAKAIAYTMDELHDLLNA
jgi:phosphoglycolate phosphatase